MRFCEIKKILFVLIGLTLINCANRGNPNGGEKDIEPPKIIKSVPENFSTNFKGDEIKIYFNEYVKIKNLQSQLIISPPMDPSPIVTPLGAASKYITIKIKDTLEENTTYAFNFGQSIVDNNEENPYPYYRYVFSTGNAIDSLSVSGYVVDAVNENPDTFISVMLYPVDSTYTDSIVYKKKPRYLTNTLDSLTSFNIDNIKAGTYKLVALKDKNNNFLFNQKTDKIGFIDEFITVPKDTSYILKLFKEEVNYKSFKPKQEGETKLIFPFEGDYKSMRIRVLGDVPEGYQSRIIKDSKADTLVYWYKPKFEIDSTFFIVSNGEVVDTFKHKFRKLEADSLQIKALTSGTLNFEDDFTIEGDVPFSTIDTSKIKLIDKDSTELPITVRYDSITNQYSFPFEKEEGQKYNLTLLPEALTSLYDEKNMDTLSYTFRTKMKSEYGNIRVNLINPKFPLIVQLVNQNNVVLYEQYTTQYPIVDFKNIAPRQYGLRVIYDTNENGKYDTGDFLQVKQPERVSFSPPIDEVRSNFDQVIEFILLD